MKSKNNAVQRGTDRKKAMMAGGASAWMRRPSIMRDKHKELRLKAQLRDAYREA